MFQGDADVLGTVEPGIAAVAWSPDDTLVTLATGALSFTPLPQIWSIYINVDASVILMTSTFDVLSEVPIETNDFGEGKTSLRAYQSV